MGSMMVRGDDIEERLTDFAVTVIGLCSCLPRTQAGRHVASQLLRSGTSPAPNYAEARGAESPGDFVHKLKIALKELNETRVWLNILERGQLAAPESLAPAKKECDEVSRILGASIRTTQNRNP